MTLGPRSQKILVSLLLIIVPLALSYYALGLNHSSLSMPFFYGNSDDIWQFSLTKVLKETGWVLWNPYLGAPEIASWHHNSAAQTSALHSIIMLAMSPIFDSAVALQQTYYLLSASLISVITYWCARNLKIQKIPAICVAIIFAFNTYRYYFIIYSFLPNYFIVPLGLLIAIWVLQDKFSQDITPQSSAGFLNRYFSSPWHFAFGIGLTIAIGISDGYYAFFTLLLLGFGGVVRFFGGDWRHPQKLAPVSILIATLIASSILIQAPLYAYKKSHHSEFYPNGVLDPVLGKQIFEAEVYSTSLKILLSPIPQHHIETFANAGKVIYKSSNDARKFPAAPPVTLGTVSALLLLMALLTIVTPNLRRRIAQGRGCPPGEDQSMALTDALLAIIAFTFLTSISGGVGTIIALIFPTIRAYDRIVIFLDLALLLLGAHLVSMLLTDASRRTKPVFITLLIAVSAFSLYDRIPKNSTLRSPAIASKFNNESRFIQTLESKVPAGSMIYQYPYSNYLRDNKYYGWGSFSHVRLYLFSKDFHWSNGGAKNSPADDWNYRISQLPFETQVAEMAALEFKAIVIDRTVVKDDEYGSIVQYLASHEMAVVDDAAAHLSYALLKPGPLHIKYKPDYRSLDHVTIDSPADLQNATLPNLINRTNFLAYIMKNHTYPITITSADQPDLFIDSETLTKGNGDRAIVPIDTLHAKLTCKKSDKGQGTIQLGLANNGPFNLSLAQGSFPLNIGVHVVNEKEEAVLWDNGTRISAPMLIKNGETGTMTFNVNAFPDLSKALETSGNSLKFELVQDANSWFAAVSCKVLP